MKITYVLPSMKFFTEGRRGRVSHAVGFSTGLLDNHQTLSIVSGPGLDLYFSNPGLNLISIKATNVAIWWYTLVKLIKEHLNAGDLIVCRWRPIVPYLLLPLTLINKDCVWLELNSLTGTQSANPISRIISTLSVMLAARYFCLIVVSENAKQQISKVAHYDPDKIVVLPNGIDTTVFEKFRFSSVSEAQCTLVYFGTKQPYYSWDLLYEVATNLRDASSINGFEIFGFDAPDTLGVKHHGQFIAETLCHSLQQINNPILILHADSSDTAKAGSPMKLYEYFSLGIPVILSDSLRTQSEVFTNVSYYRADNKDSLTSAIEQVVSQYNAQISYSQKNRCLALNTFSWQAVVERWLLSLPTSTKASL